MPTIKFTAAAVERLKAEPGARVDYFDAALPGLSLRVTGPKGARGGVAKTWSVLYRVAGQPKLRRLTIGSTELYSLAEAREKALEVIKAAGGGRDPAAEKREDRAKRPDTVEAVAEDFVEKYLKKKDRADSYVRGTQSTFENHVIPRWKGRDIKSITRRDVADLLDEIAAKPEQKNKGARKKGVAVGGPIRHPRDLDTAEMGQGGYHEIRHPLPVFSAQGKTSRNKHRLDHRHRDLCPVSPVLYIACLYDVEPRGGPMNGIDR